MHNDSDCHVAASVRLLSWSLEKLKNLKNSTGGTSSAFVAKWLRLTALIANVVGYIGSAKNGK